MTTSVAIRFDVELIRGPDRLLNRDRSVLRRGGYFATQTGAAFRDARIFALALVLFTILGAIYGLLLWLPQIVQAMGFANRTVGFIVALPAGSATAAMLWWGSIVSVRMSSGRSK